MSLLPLSPSPGMVPTLAFSAWSLPSYPQPDQCLSCHFMEWVLALPWSLCVTLWLDSFLPWSLGCGPGCFCLAGGYTVRCGPDLLDIKATLIHSLYSMILWSLTYSEFSWRQVKMSHAFLKIYAVHCHVKGIEESPSKSVPGRSGSHL
jgi:hypothetical protein